MVDAHPLDVAYEAHDGVAEMIDVLRFAIEDVSLGFDRWDDPQIRGPGLYVAVVAGRSVREYADAMGENRWPVDRCRTILDDDLFETASEVATTRDGAVVVSVDGVVQEQMVRFRSHATPDAAYAEWMGSRHMSALDVSAHEDVVVTLTLSAESGRVTRFVDGQYDSRKREELGGRWRAREE